MIGFKKLFLKGAEHQGHCGENRKKLLLNTYFFVVAFNAKNSCSYI